jgi:hypothetical protein
MDNKSFIDPTRKTAGAIYRDAQINNTEKTVIVGDLNYELRKSLVEDINDTIYVGNQEYEGRPFYITVYEKWDYQMTKAFVRRLVKTLYRPYPEADTSVYKVIPASNEVYFCWDLPHRSNMLNMLACPDIYDAKDLSLYKAWEYMNLEQYGFAKNDEGNWIANPFYTGDKLISGSSHKETHIRVQ